MGLFEIGKDYKLALWGHTFKTPESGKEIRLSVGDVLTYVGKRRVDSSMPMSECFRFKGNLGYIHPNVRGSVSNNIFVPERKNPNPKLKPISEILEDIENEQRDSTEET